MNYNKHFVQLMKNKDYTQLNCDLVNNSGYIREGKIKVTKAMANKLTIPTIIRIGFENTNALKKFPSSNQINDMLVDFLLDFKLDREYPKPNANQLETIYRTFRCLSKELFFQFLYTTLGYTKDDMKKMYKSLCVDTWIQLFTLLPKRQKLSDDEMRKLFKGKATRALLCLNNMTEEECKQLIEVGYTQYSIDDMIIKSPKRFSDKDVLKIVLRKIENRDSFRSWHTPDYYNSCCKYLLNKKESSVDIGTICNHLLTNTNWLGNNTFETKDQKLDTMLSLFNDKSPERMVETIRKYYNIA